MAQNSPVGSSGEPLDDGETASARLSMAIGSMPPDGAENGPNSGSQSVISGEFVVGMVF